MARRNSQSGISLFPFLAVLVCTMGALILLLLVTTRRMHRNQQAENVEATVAESAVPSQQTDEETPELFVALDHASDDSSPFDTMQPATNAFVIPSGENDNNDPPVFNTKVHLEEVQDAATVHDEFVTIEQRKLNEATQLRTLLESEQQRYEELQGRIESTRALLKTPADDEYDVQTRQLASLRIQQKELSARLQLGNAQLSELKEQLDSKSSRVEDVASLLRSRESALLSLRELVEDADSSAGTDATVLEFTNSTGTERSPIVVNVSESGWEFQPSGVRLTEADLKSFPDSDSPLLAGVLAIHAHRHPNTLTTKPYVLLLIRPGGSMNFYEAQRVLGSADIHFGYELLQADSNIVVGNESSGETLALKSSIAASLKRRRALYGERLAMAKSQQRTAEALKDREMRVMPDGRVLFAEDASEGDNGAFYAGGKLQPSDLDIAFDDPVGTPVPPEQSFTDLEEPNVDVMDTAAAPALDENPFAFTEDPDALSESPPHVDSIVELEATPPARDDGVFPEMVPQIAEADTNQVDTKSPFVNSLPSEVKIDYSQVQNLSTADVLRRDRGLSRNMGIGGLQAARDNEGSEDAKNFAAIDKTHKNPMADFLPEVDTQLAATQPAATSTEDIDNRSPERSGWSDSATATAESESRTAGAPEFSSPPPLSSFADGNGAAGEDLAATDVQTRMQQMIPQGGQATSSQEPQAGPDPHLLSLLKSAKENDPRLAGYFPIGVRIDRHRLTIGSFEPVDITGLTSRQILAVALNALASEIELLPEKRRADVAPTIDYVLGPNTSTIYRELEASLRKMNVPTRTVTNTAVSLRSVNHPETSDSKSGSNTTTVAPETTKRNPQQQRRSI